LLQIGKQRNLRYKCRIEAIRGLVVAGSSGPIEIRCPIYGFINLDDWEHEIINQSPFQRLRRIRQLSWTDYVYPGAMHTRFEHSIGVMQMVTNLYNGIISNSKNISELGLDKSGQERYLKLLRIAALLHDVGHGPFSHAAEELLPEFNGTNVKHEDYSLAIIRRYFKDVIENHKHNRNFDFKVDDIIGLIEGGTKAGRAAIWQDLISGQLDADRMDYLLRDSYHAGVEYGKYDWRRIAATIQIVHDPETEAPRIGITAAGRHAAEAMLIARYMMFNQVYFHKTRVILDYHFQKAFSELLPNGKLPLPDNLEEYISWDDWRVLGAIQGGGGGEHGERLRQRDFYRRAWETPEFPMPEDQENLGKVTQALGDLIAAKCEAAKSWYKVGSEDLIVLIDEGGTRPQPLSMLSTIVSNLRPSRVTRIYVREENRLIAQKRIEAATAREIRA
jgi:HD superfamily phosphohydrolase